MSNLYEVGDEVAYCSFQEYKDDEYDLIQLDSLNVSYKAIATIIDVYYNNLQGCLEGWYYVLEARHNVSEASRGRVFTLHENALEEIYVKV